MAAQTYNLTFKGYYRDGVRLPSVSGIYLVYDATRYKETETVALHELIYIGEADNVDERIRTHEKRPAWLRAIEVGTHLYFAVAEADPEWRKRAEAALIFKHQPQVNTSCKDSFNYDTTTIISDGKCRHIESPITVPRTIKRGVIF